MRTVLHLILPGFYAMVEQRLNPVLEGKPVMVAGRRWVMDASPEARLRGVRPGMSRPHARQVCPEAEWVDFSAERYLPYARQVWDRLAQHTLLIEPIHAHEAFCDLTGCPDSPRAVSDIVEQLEMARCRAVVGVASCKLVAKALTRQMERRLRFDAPTSWVERRELRSREEELAFFLPLPVSCLWPLPPQVLERLRHLGLAKISDIVRVPERDLARQFGLPEAERLRRYACARDTERVRPLYPPPALVESLALDEALEDEASLRFCLDRLAGRLSRQMSHRREGCRRLILELRLAGGGSAEGALSLPRSLHEEEEIGAALWRAFQRCRPPAPIEGIRVVAEDLEPFTSVQLDLFRYGSQERRRSLERVFEVLRERFGPRSLDYGSRRFPALVTRRERFLAVVMGAMGR